MISKKRKVLSSIFFLLGIGIILASTSIYLPALISNFQPDNELSLSFVSVDPNITKISTSPTNSVFLKATVTDLKGYPQRWVRVTCEVSSVFGTLNPTSLRTNDLGEAVFQFQPSYKENKSWKPSQKIVIRCQVGKQLIKELQFDLIPSPVVIIHGYRETSSVFSNMQDHLSSLGYQCHSFEYDSTKGIAKSAESLSLFLKTLQLDLSKLGIRQDRFTLITHSMGGLVARYYTTSKEYLIKNNIEKIIFISVPHRGSHMAVIGQNVYKDESLRDLDPDGNLFKNIFPSFINQGLHPNIPIGNILGEFDEVVTSESGSLEDWDIKLEMFQVGENQLTVDNIIKGKMIDAQIHHNILNNRKIFERVTQMLQSDLPSPKERE